jgi:hypothetical protein
MKNELIEKDGILAPRYYWDYTKEEKEKLLNKCGCDPVTSSLVPNSIFGTDLSMACKVHDAMYINGKTPADKRLADDLFDKNLVISVNKSSKGFMRSIKLGVAKVYYWAASFFGHLYF